MSNDRKNQFQNTQKEVLNSNQKQTNEKLSTKINYLKELFSKSKPKQL